MKQRQFVMHLVAAYMLCNGIVSNKAIADVFAPSHGGNGGANFGFTCPNNKYLIGLGGQSGEWVDYLTLICAKKEIVGNPPNKEYIITEIEEAFKIGASNGGGPMRAQCPPNSVLDQIDFGWGEYDGGGAIVNDYIRLTCLDPQGNVVGTPSFGVDAHGPTDGHGTSACENGRAVGLHGRAGLFVDQLGIICR